MSGRPTLVSLSFTQAVVVEILPTGEFLSRMQLCNYVTKYFILGSTAKMTALEHALFDRSVITLIRNVITLNVLYLLILPMYHNILYYSDHRFQNMFLKLLSCCQFQINFYL